MAYFSFSWFRQGALWAASFALLAAFRPDVSAQTSAASASDGFNPNVTGIVYALALQPNGAVVLGGKFTSMQPNGAFTATARNNVARVNADGTLDAGFNPGANDQVLAVALQPNGQILIGGYFTTLQPNGAASATTRNHIARLNSDGSLDTTFDPDAKGSYTGQVNSIAIQTDGRILIGGSFTSLQPNGAASPTAINHLARLNADGTLDTTFNPNPNGPVTAIYQEKNGQILIGGTFTALQPNGAAAATTELDLARLNSDGSLDATFSPNPNGEVAAIAMQSDGQILVVGHFTQMEANGAALPTNVDYIARLNPNGTQDSSFLTNAAGPINTLALQSDGKIVIGGTIGQITNGTALTTFVANYLARINRDGSPDTSFLPNPNYTVNALALQPDGKLVLGGAFTQVAPTLGSQMAQVASSRNAIARINPDGTVDADFNPNAFGGIGAMAVQSNGQILIGGIFNSVNGSSHANLARLNADGSVDNTFNPSTNGTVEAIVIQSNGQILIGGNFTLVNSTITMYMARLNTDGSLDTSYLPEPNGEVKALLLQPNGQCLVGGNFSGFNLNGYYVTTTDSGVARLNVDGTVDLTFQPNANGTVNAILYQPATVAGQHDAVIIGGVFGALSPYDPATNSVVVVNTPYMARIDATNGQADATYDNNVQVATANFYPNPNGAVNTLALQSNGMILVGGAFTSLQPNPTTSTSVVNGQVVETTTPFTQCFSFARLYPNGSLDTSFSPQANGVVLKLAVNSTTGQILTGGLFTSISGSTRNYVARLNSDGSVDSTFSPSLNRPAIALQYLANNQFLVGGAFTTVVPPGASSTTPAFHIARFNSDGSLDTTFQPSLQTGSQVSTVVVEPDNKIIIGGTFTSMQGIVATNIVRFNADTSQDDSFYANANGPVNAIVEEEDGSFMVGGGFSAIGHGYANFLARLNPDSTLDTAALAAPDGPVNAIIAHTNFPTVIGGAFAHVGGVVVANLARIAYNGSVDTTFGPNPNAAVNAVAAQANGQYVIGGAFTAVGVVPRGYLARINADGSLDTGFNPIANGTVGALLIQPDGKILLGGNFTVVGGLARTYIARLNSDGSVDTAFNPGANGPVETMVLQALPPGSTVSVPNGSSGDQILVGGAFTTMAGTARNYLARLNFDGSLDTTFNPNPDGAVTALALQDDGKPVLAGAFANVGGQPRGGLARLSDPAGTSQSITISPDVSTVTWTLSGGPELTNVIFEMSTDEVVWTTIGYGTRLGTGNTWQLSGLQNLPLGSNFLILALGQMATSQGGSASTMDTIQEFNVYPVSVVASASTAASVSGQPFYYEIAATNSPTSYSAAALPPGLSMNLTTGAISGTPTQTGTYVVPFSVTNAGGTTNGSLVITVAAPSSAAAVAPAARLINVSTRGGVDATDPLIVGFVIGGSAPKTVLLRAVGPGLSSIDPALTPLLTKPSMVLCNSSGQVVLTNQGWDGSSTLMQIFTQTGAFPLTVGSADAAAVTSLVPGNYTLIVNMGPNSVAGTVLAEIYDADVNPEALPQRLINLSGRGTVNASNLVIGGFVISGTGPKTVLIRGAGPALASLNVTNPLAAPVLNLYTSQNVLLAQNAGWGTPVTVNASYPAASASTISSDAATVGAFSFASGSTDAAIVVTLAPGIYSGQISAASGQTGTALFEIYELP